MRYRKSVKICKGVRMNFSMSGPSITVGGRGCSVNFGKNGTYLNTGIPGTGFYNRQKISGGTTSNSKSKTKSNTYTEKRNFKIHYADDASIVIRDEAGLLVTDTSILRQIKASPEYKQEIERLSELRLKEINSKVDQVVNIYKNACEVLTLNEYRAGISDIRRSVYVAQEYDVPMPTDEDVRIELTEQAKKNISTIQFWKKNQLIEEYVQQHFRETLAKKMVEWKNNKDIFEFDESQKVIWSQEECQQKCTELIQLINNEEDAIHESVDQWMSHIEFPFEFAVNYGIREKDLLVDLDLPEIEEMPLEYAQRMANGTVKVKSRTKKDIKEDYFKCVLGMAVFFATHLMGCAIGIERVIISAYTQRPDNKGVINDDYIYSVKFDREGLSKINLEDNVSNIFFAFENICEVKSDKTFKTIIPFE